MIWYIAVVVIAVTVFAVSLRKQKRLRKQMRPHHAIWWGDVTGPAVMTLLFGGLLAIISNVALAGVVDTQTVVVSNQLSTLQDGSQTTGSFFLGSGYVDGEQVFSYYEKRGGAFYLDSIDADHAKVVESNETPRVEHTCKKSDNIWFSVFTGKCWNNWDYTFYVPKGSVATNYTLDAK